MKTRKEMPQLEDSDGDDSDNDSSSNLVWCDGVDGPCTRGVQHGRHTTDAAWHEADGGEAIEGGEWLCTGCTGDAARQARASKR